MPAVRVASPDIPVPISLAECHAAWRRARRGKQPSANQLAFASRWLDNLQTLHADLRAGVWQPRRTVSFVVEHPKTREIHAPDFADRVVHHWLVGQLEKFYEPIFIHDSYANRAGKGSHAAVDRLQRFMRQRNGQGGFLQIDIHNFFNSIHRPTLYALLKDRLSRPARAGRRQHSESGRFSLSPAAMETLFYSSCPRRRASSSLILENAVAIGRGCVAPSSPALPPAGEGCNSPLPSGEGVGVREQRINTGLRPGFASPTAVSRLIHLGSRLRGNDKSKSNQHFSMDPAREARATAGHLETPVMPAQAGIQLIDFTGLPPARERRIEGFSRYPAEPISSRLDKQVALPPPPPLAGAAPDLRLALRGLCHKLLANPVEEYCRDPQAAARVPPHKRLRNARPGCGLPIGNLTSQFFANVYLNELDQFIKHRLKVKHYVRYVDDAVLLADDLETLRQWQAEIEVFLRDRLRLRLREPSVLAPLNQGVDFLGYVVWASHRRVRRRVVAHCRARLQDWQARHVTVHARCGAEGETPSALIRATPAELDALHAQLASYWGHFGHAHSLRLKQSLFVRFIWLHALFDLDRTGGIAPRWVLQGETFDRQCDWLRGEWPEARCQVQKGYGYTVFAAPAGAATRLTAVQTGWLRHGTRRREIVRWRVPLAVLEARARALAPTASPRHPRTPSHLIAPAQETP